MCSLVRCCIRTHLWLKRRSNPLAFALHSQLMQLYVMFSSTHVFLSGIFIYPLEENSIVVGFESMISNQIITLQIKEKAKIEDCYLDCCNTSNGALQGGSGNAESLNQYILMFTINHCATKCVWDQYFIGFIVGENASQKEMCHRLVE